MTVSELQAVIDAHLEASRRPNDIWTEGHYIRALEGMAAEIVRLRVIENELRHIISRKVWPHQVKTHNPLI